MIRPINLGSIKILALFICLINGCSPTVIRALKSTTKTSDSISLASATITNTSPTNNTTYSLTFGAVTGTYDKYCILENVTTVASCSWTTGSLPASYVVNATENAKVLSVWLMDAALNVSTRVNTNSVTLDTTAPTSAFTWSMASPISGSVSSDTTPALSGSGAEPGASITTYGDSGCSTSLGTATVAGDGTFNVSAFTLSVDGSKPFYFKIADSASNASACTNTAKSYTLNTCTPSTLEWVTQPTNTVAGSSITSPVVRLKDSGGNICVYSDETATITISSNPGFGTLSGTSTVTFASGVATFAGLSIDKAATAYVLAAQSSGGIFAAASSTFNITAGSASKLSFLQAPAGYFNSSTFSPALTVRVTDSFGNLVNTVTNITLSLDANPGSTVLGGTTTKAAVSGTSTFNDLSIGVSASGYTIRAVSSTGGISDAVSDPFDIYGAGTGLNLEVPIEMTSSGFSSLAGSSFPVASSSVSINTNDYNGSPTFRFEVVASNSDTSNRNVALTDILGNVLVSVRVPLSSPNATRYTQTSAPALATFTPNSGYDIYRVRINPTTSAGQLKVYSARIIITQTAATKTKIFIPLMSGVQDSLFSTTNSSKVDQSSNTSTYTQPIPSSYGIWKKITSGLATLDPIAPFTIEAVLDSTVQGTTVNAALFNKTTGLMVAGTELSASNVSTGLTSSSFLSSATNFNENDDFEIRIKGAGSVRANLFQAGLWVKLINLTKAESYYRIARQYTTSSSVMLANQRAMIPTGSFSNPTVKMVCSGKDQTSGTMAYNLNTAGASDSTTVGTNIASGNLSFGSTSSSVISTPSLTVTANDRFMVDFVYTTGSPSLSQCFLKVDSQ